MLQHWVRAAAGTSPEGTVDSVGYRRAENTKPQPSLRDLFSFSRELRVETLSYCQSSLRDANEQILMA